ncbi:glutathione S-transferase family protein [Pendulispora albinea]|uniref:Glutathione S-transferase family protein n=1 Tax=Pendulispora albinea TaxID=2741071 RepID=A0ABZ2LVG5_9BACT
MKLYDFAFSPNCRKVRSVAYELGVELELVAVDLVKEERRGSAFLAINPNGLVPVLEDGDFILWESNAIIHYLATTASRPGAPSLVPSDARARAEVERWLCWQLAHFGPAVRKVAFERIAKKITGRGVPDQSLIELGIAEFKKCSRILEASLGNKEYVVGELSLADFALASFYSLAEPCGLEVRTYPRVDAWLGRMLTRESMKRALADAEALMR